MTAQSQRSYPLEIEELVGGDGEVLGVFSKGHHPAGCALAGLAGDPFLADALDHLDLLGLDDLDDLDDKMAVDSTSTAVAFQTWRRVATRRRPDAGGGLGSPAVFRLASPGSRGAFPVTVLYLDDLNHHRNGQAREGAA